MAPTVQDYFGDADGSDDVLYSAASTEPVQDEWNAEEKMKECQDLLAQLTAPVKWTQTVVNMVADGASDFTEVGPGKVLQGLVSKITANQVNVNQL